MRDDTDFEGYLAARWPSLVRTLVLLGCPEELAPDVALDAMARCRKHWPGNHAAVDVDVLAHRALVEAWADRRRTPWWDALGPATQDDADVDGALAPELVDELDRLPGDTRAQLVLQRQAGLSPTQAAESLGRPARTGDRLPATPTAAQMRGAVEGLVVLAPPDLADLVGRAGPRGRLGSRRTRVGVAAGVAVVLLLAGLTWWTGGDAGEDELEAVSVERVGNPAEAAWYANGELHLAHVTLELPRLRDFAVMGTGAVYGDTDGRVVLVADDGQRELIGTKDPGVPLVASDERGWVAWVDPTGDTPVLVVHEPSSRSTVGELELSDVDVAEIRPLAVDDDRVFYVDGSGAHEWRPPDGEPVLDPTDPFGLVDVASRNRAYQIARHVIQVDQGFFNLSFRFTGAGAQLSPDGDHVLTRVPDDGAFSDVLIYDTRSGESVWTGLTDEDVAVAAALGRDGAVTYVVARAEDRPAADAFMRSSFSGQLELRSCNVEGPPPMECQSLVRFPSTGSLPLVSYSDADD